MSNLGMIALSVAITLIVTSLYRLISTAVRKRVMIRSPEAEVISQLVPAVNALLETNSPMMQGIIAILEAQQGQCNGNVTRALEVNRRAKEEFDKYLRECSKVGIHDSY